VLPPCFVLLILTPFSKLAACLAGLIGTGVLIFAAIKIYLIFQRKGLTDLNETLPFFLRGGGALILSQAYYAFQRPKTVGVWFGVEMTAFLMTRMGWVFFGIIKDPVPPNPAIAGNPQVQGNPADPQGAPGPAAPPAVTGDAVLDKALADLGGNNTVSWQVAADQLAKMQPNQHRAVIAQKLAERAGTPELFPRQSIICALGVWATPAEVPVLINALRDENGQVRSEAIKALAKTKDEQAVAPLVQCFAEGTNRFEAEQALKDLGPMAEKQLLPLLAQDQEVFLRLSTIGILKEIGTRESVPTLKGVIAEDNVHLKLPAQEAIKTINMRARKNNPPK
jgi:HEAT repeat protein